MAREARPGRSGGSAERPFSRVARWPPGRSRRAAQRPRGSPLELAADPRAVPSKPRPGSAPRARGRLRRGSFSGLARWPPGRSRRAAQRPRGSPLELAADPRAVPSKPRPGSAPRARGRLRRGSFSGLARWPPGRSGRAAQRPRGSPLELAADPPSGPFEAPGNLARRWGPVPWRMSVSPTGTSTMSFSS